jgi:outer membrane lipoprotein
MKKEMLLFIFVLFWGCAPVISQSMREQVDKDLTPQILFKDPDAYKGSIVILGGIIISSRSAKEGTYIEVLQNPLDSRDRPKDTDMSNGRFIIFSDKYLDPAIYSKGKAVTVAGEVLGKMIRPLDDIEYPYTLIRSKEIHIVEPGRKTPLFFSIGVGTTF